MAQLEMPQAPAIERLGRLDTNRRYEGNKIGRYNLRAPHTRDAIDGDNRPRMRLANFESDGFKTAAS
jgi:hypothetical protein